MVHIDFFWGSFCPQFHFSESGLPDSEDISMEMLGLEVHITSFLEEGIVYGAFFICPLPPLFRLWSARL